MHIHVRRIIHQFAKGTERADDGCRDDFLQQVLQSTVVGNIGRNPRDRMQMTVLPDDQGKHAVTLGMIHKQIVMLRKKM